MRGERVRGSGRRLSVATTWPGVLAAARCIRPIPPRCRRAPVGGPPYGRVTYVPSPPVFVHVVRQTGEDQIRAESRMESARRRRTRGPRLDDQISASWPRTS